MSMPQIPEEKNRPSLCEVTIDILKSVALEETALAHILNAEGERSQAIVKRYECCRDGITLDELNESIRQTEKILNTIIMKEWLLLRKMETACEIKQKMPECEEKKDGCGGRCCRECAICCRCGGCKRC